MGRAVKRFLYGPGFTRSQSKDGELWTGVAIEGAPYDFVPAYLFAPGAWKYSNNVNALAEFAF
jgi:hypothetical protein